MTLPRRSARIASKPTHKYFDENEAVINAIETLCDKKGWLYTDDLLTEYKGWLSTADKYDIQKYNWYSGSYIPKTDIECAMFWAKKHSTTLKNQAYQIKLQMALLKRCEKKCIEYNHSMYKELIDWASDPAHQYDINYMYLKGNTPTIYKPRPASQCVNKWFAALKKNGTVFPTAPAAAPAVPAATPATPPEPAATPATPPENPIFNELYSGIPVTMKFEDTPEYVENVLDVKKDERLSMPSGLTKIRVPTYYGYKLLDVTGTTNEQALKKLLDFYSNPIAAESRGDHIYFEGLFLMKDGTYGIFWGS
jgi:hypothetical protein